MLNSLMQDDFPLTLAHIRRGLDTKHHAAQVVSAEEDGATRLTFGQIARRIDRVSHVLTQLGVERGDRVATFAWNTHRHFELYLAIPSIGAVLHTLNIRLFSDQLRYIVNHAEDSVVFVDADLVAVLAPLAEALHTVRHFVIMGDGETETLPNALRYEELLAQASPEGYDYPDVDERHAAALCYTSGTTGNPKGVLYSHRSISLHSSALLMADVLGLSSRECVLAVVPMFHANAWGLPYGAALAGADLILPNRFLQAKRLAALVESERPTVMACVPTIFADVLRYAESNATDLSSLTNAMCGGSAVPRHLMRQFQERHGVRIYQVWGMTETSPLCTVSRPSGELDEDEHWDLRATQGRPVPWVELRIAAPDEDDRAGALPDGAGEIEVRGPWVAASYYNDDTANDKFRDGWLRTGDIASINDRGFVTLSDRTKDVIKSGGEWISSVELENQLMSHPDVLEAAVIAKPDDRWAERPLACVVLRDGAAADPAGLLEHLRGRVARWWLPDEIAFIEAIPKTSVGKFDKKVLRSMLENDLLPGRVRATVAGDSGVTTA